MESDGLPLNASLIRALCGGLQDLLLCVCLYASLLPLPLLTAVVSSAYPDLLSVVNGRF